MTQLIMPEAPEGFKYTGEYRRPLKGEYYLDGDDRASLCSAAMYMRMPILKSARWRAIEGGKYYRISTLNRLKRIKVSDDRGTRSNQDYESGNYFRYASDANKAMKAIQEILLEN